MTYSLVLKGGTVVDPSQGLHAIRDVAFADGKVAAIGPNLVADAKRVIDISGRHVFPGLVDLHTHVFRGFTDLGVDADTCCLPGGVTTSVDAGSAGSITFPGFREHIIDRARSRIFAYVHLASVGLVNSEMGELFDLRYADPEGAIRTIQEHPGVCVGVKLRMGILRVKAGDPTPLRLCRQVAEQTGTHMMVHITNPALPLDEMFGMFERGDVITHLFHARGESVVANGGVASGKVIDALLRARERGVIADVGHGNASLAFSVTRAALANGFLPDTISTDLHIRSAKGPCHLMMATTMSKFLALGVGLEDVVRMSTINPARVIGQDHAIGSLRPGHLGDAAVFELEQGEFPFHDSEGETIIGGQRLMPIMTILGGELVATL